MINYIYINSDLLSSTVIETPGKACQKHPETSKNYPSINDAGISLKIHTLSIDQHSTKLFAYKVLADDMPGMPRFRAKADSHSSSFRLQMDLGESACRAKTCPAPSRWTQIRPPNDLPGCKTEKRVLQGKTVAQQRWWWHSDDDTVVMMMMMMTTTTATTTTMVFACSRPWVLAKQNPETQGLTSTKMVCLCLF